jgi:hypothetical protein
MLLRLEMLRLSSYEVDEFVKVKDNSGSNLDHPFVQSDEFRNDATARPA